MRKAMALATALLLAGSAGMAMADSPAPGSATVHPDRWPEAKSPAAITDAATEARIDALLARMTIEQKVGQLIQADISTITPKDLETYPLGSILAGGNSGPNGNERSSAEDWAKLVGEFRAVSLQPQANGVAIPIIFGVDAVHGHNNVPGATLFPHNIGLGAAHDPELIRRIGQVTAAEIAGSGIEWTFAPTLAVPQDLRWGRSYEGYASDPKLVADYATAMVLGLQGRLVAGRSVDGTHVAATAKHFLADGGTFEGKDQGDARIGEEELIAKHAQGYPAAIDAGADDVESTEDGHDIWTSVDSLHEVAKALEAKLGEAEGVKLAWRPTLKSEVADESVAQTLFKLIDTLDDDDDVQTVWGNYEIPDAVMEKLG